MEENVEGGSRKRGATAFLEDPLAFVPPSQYHQLAKRGRRSPSAAAIEDLGVSLEFDPIDALKVVFPGADPQLLWNYFEASGNVLDAAIKGFKDYLATGSTESGYSVINPSASNTGSEAASSEVTFGAPATNISTSGSQWAELIVREISSASDLIDAKNRAFRTLELFKNSAVECSNLDAAQKMQEEHKILKQMLGGLLHQNGVLKRAFLIQHSRLKDYQHVLQERSQLKEVVCRYQERIKELEDRNYVLSFHLEQSKQQSSIVSDRRNPDVF